MVVITCTECESDLIIHCGHTSCTWLACRNKECEAEMYDLDAGSRLMRSGVVEVWGEA